MQTKPILKNLTLSHVGAVGGFEEKEHGRMVFLNVQWSCLRSSIEDSYIVMHKNIHVTIWVYGWVTLYSQSYVLCIVSFFF